MKIILFPQIRERNKIWYKIEDEKITATINGVSDTFDFTGVPDGELHLYDSNGEWLVETTLPEVPFVQAKKENGELLVEIIFSIDMYERDERLFSEKPMSVQEFNSLMLDLQKRKKEG